MHPFPHDSASRLEAGQSKSLGEKQSSPHVSSDSRPTPHRRAEDRALTERMPSAGRLLLALLLSFLVTFGLATALSPGDWHRRPYQRGDAAPPGVEKKGDDGASFTSLLQAAAPESLHELLHKYFPERFKHGVWESDLSAVEAVRRADAALAVSIVQMARRADNGTTTTPPPSSSTTTTDPPSGTTTTSPPDNESTTSPSPTPQSTTPSATATTSSNSPGQGSSSTTGPTMSTTTTSGRSDTSSGTSTGPDTTKPTSSSPSSVFTTHSSGSGFVTASHSGSSSTSNPRGGSSTTTGRPTFSSLPSSKPVTLTFTSTMDNGGVVLVTQTSWVEPDPVQTGSSTSTRPSPTLQNAAPARQSHASGAFVGVVLGAMLLV